MLDEAAPDFLAISKASSSIGRAAVSKTAGWGFDSLLACQGKRGPDLCADLVAVGIRGADLGYYEGVL